jgi:uncharacterized protein YjbI with pentapeptide repeats
MMGIIQSIFLILNRIKEKWNMTKRYVIFCLILLVCLGSDLACAFDSISLQNLKATKTCKFCDLSFINLANNPGINMQGADMSFSNLFAANLAYANLSDARLGGANLSHASLPLANLSGAFLNGVNFSNANLGSAYLKGANIAGANFTGANLYGATWPDGSTCKVGSIGTCIK